LTTPAKLGPSPAKSVGNAAPSALTRSNEGKPASAYSHRYVAECRIAGLSQTGHLVREVLDGD